ncbi:MAG: hypothetical protein K9H64_21250 [Bacteroidales bacterium]|nr:hypothetical protein [Bacteroidales bacterium]MCF8458567.1 hypothetical protein [Bacteroidales bacterium]
MRKYFVLILIIIAQYSNAQSFNDDKTALTNFIKRMYIASPFEGVKVIEDLDKNYLISVVSLEKAKYPSESTMIRVAETKARSQASRFFNGSQISSDFIIKTTETTNKDTTSTIIETIESIRENSIGFVNQIELLTNFNIDEDKRMLFVYYKELQTE